MYRLERMPNDNRATASKYSALFLLLEHMLVRIQPRANLVATESIWFIYD